MKKIVCLVLSLVMLLAVMSACKPEEHVHTFDTMWDMDETDHWHPATCEHTEEVSDKEAHMDEDGNDLCDVCGYAMNHDHTHATEWSFNKDEHYHAPTCGCNANDKKYQKDNAPHVDENNDAICDVCTYDYDHSHTYGEDWVKADETYHWHAPTCGHDVDGADKEEHKDEDNNGLCDGCEWNFDHEHTFEEAWTTDADYHWQKPTCGHDILGQKNPHRDADGDGKCDGCEQTFDHYHDIDWDVWTSDKDNHWHATKGDCAECKDAEGNAIVADFGAHTEWKEDGICDVCEHIVFHLYKIDVTVPEYVGVVNDKGGPILDAEGNPIELPFIVKEGNSLEFYLSIPGTHRLEGVEGAEVDMVNYIEIKQEDGSPLYLYKVTITPESDVTIKPVVNKLSSVEIIEENTVVFNVEKSWSNITGTVTVNIPEAGTYTMFCVTDKWMKFFNPNTGAKDSSITFNAEAGELTVSYEYFAMDKGEIELEYVLLKTDATFVLPYLQGEGYTMPTNTKVTFQFTLPEPGLYLFTTESGELTWVTPDNSDGTVEPQFFECTYAGQQFSHTCWMQTDAAATFDFDWNIMKLPIVGALGVGDNTVNVSINSYYGYTFTAPYTGDYAISWPDSMSMKECAALYGTDKHMYTYSGGFLRAGQTITLYSAVNLYAQEVPTEDFSATINIEYQGYNPSVDYNGNPTLDPYATWNYTPDVSGYYTFSVPEGAQITIDGGTTWYSGDDCKVVLTADQVVPVMVKTDSGEAVKVTISTTEFKHTFALGTADYKFVPGNDYTVKLAGFVSPTEKKPAVLTWTDVNIVVSYNGLTVESGVVFEYTPDTELVVRYNGTAEAQINFVLSENYEAPPADVTLVEGSNHVVVPGGPFGKEMIFTATEAGTYLLMPIEGEENAKIFVDGEEVALPYEFTLEQGGILEIKIAPANNMSDTIDLKIVNKLLQDAEALKEMLDGIYVYKNEFNEVYYDLVFGVGYFGDINLVVTDNYMADYVNIDGTYTVAVENGVVKIYAIEGYQYVPVDTFTLYRNADGKLVLKLSESIEYVLERSEGGVEPGPGPGEDDNVLVLGENAINVPAGYDGINITFTAPATGTYTLAAAEGETNYFLLYGYTSYSYGSDEDLPLVLTLAEGEVVEINLSTNTTEADEINLVISEGAGGEELPAGPEGEHEVYISSNWAGATLTLSGGQEGAIYTISAAEGDTMAMLMDDNYDEIPMPYEFALGAGQTITLKVNARNAEGVSVRFLVEKTDKPYHEHSFADVWSTDAAGHWHAATCEHTEEVSGWESHSDYDVDGYCDSCQYKMYDVVGVTLQIPEGTYTYSEMAFNVASGDAVSVVVVAPATFDVSTLKVEGAELDGDPYVAYGELYINLVAKNVTADLTIKVEIEAAKIQNTVAAEGTVTVDASNVEAMTTVTAPITFNATEAGTYVVSSSSYDYFSLKEDGSESSYKLTFEVKEPGEITLYAVYEYYGFGEPVQEVNYEITKVANYMLPSVVGSGLMIPNGEAVNVSVTIDTPGLYYVTAGEASVNNREGIIVKTTELNQVVTFSVYNSDYSTDAEFLALEWDVSMIGDLGSLNVGENMAIAEYDYIYYYTFTAKDAGSYRFFLTDGSLADLYQLDELDLISLGNSYVVNMKQGETVTVYIKGTEKGEFAVDTMRVDFLSNYVTGNEDGSYTAISADTVVNTWIAPSAGIYKFELTNGTMTLDGESWYRIYAEMELEEGQIVYFMVRSDDGGNSVTMNVEKLVFETEMTVGANTLILRPGVEYEITLSGGSPVLSGWSYSYMYALSWDTSLPLTFTNADGEEIAANEVFSVSYRSSAVIYAVYEGEAGTSVEVTLLDMAPIEVEIFAGDNSLTLQPDREYTVYLPYGATWSDGDMHYILTWDNAEVLIYNNGNAVSSGSEFGNYNAKVTLKYVGTTEVTVNLNLVQPVEPEPDPGEGGESGASLTVGSNTVVGNSWGDYSYTFTATESGTYKITVTGNGMAMNWSTTGEGTGSNTYILDAGESVTFTPYANSGEVEFTVVIEKV